MKVAVGTQNPVKVEAVRKAFTKAFGECEIVSIQVSSGVSDMPMSVDESIKGAKNRAKQAIEKSAADFGVGLEGGFEKTKHGTFLCGFVAVIDKDGCCGIGGSAGILMPDILVKKVAKEGRELGDVMDELRGLKNTKQHDGASGFFTNNLVSRTDGFERAIIYALARFFKKELY